MKYYRRALYDQFVHFYNTISDDGTSEAQLRGKIGGLVRRARKEISPDWPEEEQKIIFMLAIYICLIYLNIVKECL